MTRERATNMSASECASFPWHAMNTSWRPVNGQPAVFGLTIDTREALRRYMRATALQMPMTMVARRVAVPIWTPCTNLAFTLCAARGFLHNKAVSKLTNAPKRRTNALLHLATRGADIMSRCKSNFPEPRVQRLFNVTCPTGNKSVACLHKLDGTWDECVVTKHQYCVLTRVCANGNDVWNKTGAWECQLRVPS